MTRPMDAAPPSFSSADALRCAIESAPIAIAILDRELRHLATSRKFRETYGVAPGEDLVGRSHYEVFPTLPPDFRDVHARALQGESSSRDEEPMFHADGSVDWFSWTVGPWLQPDGSIGGIVISIERVTESVRARRALEAAEARYRGVFDQAGLGVARLAVEGIFLDVNDRYCAITGYARDQLVGRSIRDITEPADIAVGQAETADLLAGKIGVFSIEKRYRRPDGEPVWVRLTASVVRRETGEPDYLVAVVEDITDWKRSDDRLRGLFNIQTVAILFWSLGALTATNDAFLRMTGYTREETIGLTWQELTPPEFHEVSWKAVNEVMTRGEAVPYEKQYLRKDGSRWWGLFAPRRIGEEVVEIVLDVTERKQAESVIRQLNENLEVRVAEEVTARLNAEDALRQSQKMEAIGQLTGGVAHDFNNLLTVIRSSADLLRREDLPEARRQRYVQAIAETADRAAKLTGQLLAFARRQALKPEVFNIGERVDRIAEMLRTVVGGHIRLETDTHCETCYVEADPTQFETALVNMAVNARDAMEDGGVLSIRVAAVNEVPSVRGHRAASGPFVGVWVHDTGCGIPADKIGKIFEPFFTTKAIGKGTGLGLSQVYGFAKQSGGEVDVRSVPGEGAEFVLYLPRAPEPVAVPELPMGEPATLPDRAHILLVEDNEQVGAFSSQMLAELGFQTSWAPNGPSALAMIEATPNAFDAVFSDVVMPGMSGIELGREIQRRRPDLPVVLTSGYSHVLANEGAQGFELLQKPYSADELTRVLRRALNAPRRSI